MKNKDYEVEIYSRYGNGRYGKKHYFGWVLNTTSKVAAESFALELLSEMTANEIRNEIVEKTPATELLIDRLKYDVNEKAIGINLAQEYFTIKASLLKG